VFGFLKRLTQGAQAAPDDDPEVLQEMEDGAEAVRQAEAAGALPVLETQHRAIGTDTCHLAVPASMPDNADAFGKLFITDRRVVFAGGAPMTVGIGRINKVDRHHRDVVIVSGGDSLVRFRCNSFGDAMLAVWMLQRLKK
jgi:precorrin-6B methylase 1